MEIKEQVFEIRTRIAALEGQKEAANTELKFLRSIKCPACSGSGQIERREESETSTLL